MCVVLCLYVFVFFMGTCLYMDQTITFSGEKVRCSFLSFFFYLHFLESIHSKQFFSLQKILLFKLFKMAVNQTEYARCEQNQCVFTECSLLSTEGDCGKIILFKNI